MSGPFRRFGDYDFRHFVATQADVGAGELVHRLLALTDCGRNSWFAAREGRNEIDGYIADVERGHALADAQAASRSRRRAVGIGLQCRYALIGGLMRELAANHRPELAARYVQAGMWSRDQALAWARLANDPQKALPAIVNALRGIEERRRDEVAHMALDMGARIADADGRVLGVANLAADLPARLLGRALEIVAAEENQGSRVGGLRELVPKLTRPLRLEALRIAQAFSEPRLRAEALAVVALSLEEPERSQVFETSLATAISAAVESRTPSTLDALAHSLPREQQLELLRRLDGEPNAASSRNSVLSIYLASLAEDEPESVLQRMPGVRQQRDDILTGVVVGFAKKGRWEEADSVAGKISVFWLGLKSDAWQTILAILPEPEWPPWVERFATLDAQRRLYALPHFVESGAIPAPLIRRLAGTLTDSTDSLKASAIMAGLLSPAELDEIFEQCLSGRSTPSDCLANVAPFLSISQVRRGLEAVGVSLSSINDPQEALLVRLAHLGQVDEALAYVAGLRGLHESKRAHLLARLAPHVPDAGVPALRAATRPDSVAKAKVRARAALLPWLPVEAGNEIVSSVTELTDPQERAVLLSEITGKLPAAPLERAIAQMLADVPALIGSHRRDVLRQVFRALSDALRRSPSATATARSIGLACDASIPPQDQVTLLLDLASAGGANEHVRRCLEAALHIAVGDPAAAGIFAGELCPAHSSALGELVTTLEKPADLVALVVACAGYLDDDSKALAARRVAAVSAARLRLSGLESLLIHLPAASRRRVAAEEMARCSEWPWPEVFVFACGMLARHLPESHLPPQAEIYAAFRLLPPQQQIAYTGYLAGFSEIGEKAIQAAFAAACTLSPLDKGAALVGLSPWLNRRQIEETLDDWDSVYHGGLREAFAIRAAGMPDPTLLYRCLLEERKDYARSELIASIAPELPLELIPLLAGLEEGSWFSGLSTQGLSALAVRAAELGDFELAQRLVDARGTSRIGGDQTLEIIYRLAPASCSDELLARAGKMIPRDRAATLAEFVCRVPAEQRKSLARKIVSDSRALPSEQRAEVFGKLRRELLRLPVSELVSVWTESLHQSAGQSREKVLEDVVLLGPILAQRLGSVAAVELDRAIAFGGVDYWP